MRLICLLIASLLSVEPLLGCAPLLQSSRGDLAVANETAVIVWGAHTHTEYFVRRAEFRSDQPDIGFLVPTPSPPRLTSSNDDAFSPLDDVIRPRRIIHPRNRYFPMSILLLPAWRFVGGTAAGELGPVPGVDILSSGRVGDYDATVLRASDMGGLAAWLSRHDFVMRPAVRSWLQSYVRRGWTLTAFKVDHTAQDDQSADGSLVLHPVCMAFHADRPFYPYSEPADGASLSKNPLPRLLRVYVIAGGRMSGAFEGSTAAAWPGVPVMATPWSKVTAFEVEDRAAFCDALGIPKSAFPSGAWMTAFEDHSSPRPGIADVAFTPAAMQTELAPAPQVVDVPRDIWVWIDPYLLGLLLVVWILRRRSRRKRFMVLNRA